MKLLYMYLAIYLIDKFDLKPSTYSSWLILILDKTLVSIAKFCMCVSGYFWDFSPLFSVQKGLLYFNLSVDETTVDCKVGKGQLISEWLFGGFNFPKSHAKVWWISALESKKWSNQKDRGTLFKTISKKRAFNCLI